MSQRDRVLQMLKMGPVCGTEFLRAYMPRYGARIFELRQDGWEIDRTVCQLHDHESVQYVFALREQDQLSLAL